MGCLNVLFGKWFGAWRNKRWAKVGNYSGYVFTLNSKFRFLKRIICQNLQKTYSRKFVRNSAVSEKNTGFKSNIFYQRVPGKRHGTHLHSSFGNSNKEHRCYCSYNSISTHKFFDKHGLVQSN